MNESKKYIKKCLIGVKELNNDTSFTLGEVLALMEGYCHKSNTQEDRVVQDLLNSEMVEPNEIIEKIASIHGLEFIEKGPEWKTKKPKWPI